MKSTFKPGQKVIYKKTLYRQHSSRRARDISASAHGDGYSYTVDKYRKVLQLTPDGRVILLSPKGKSIVVNADSPCLMKAGIWRRLIRYRSFAKIRID